MPEALLVIDVQKAFDDADFRGRRNNPECEANVAALLAAWEGPRVYVRHDSDEAGSPLAPGHPGTPTHTFDRRGPDGTVMTADELARATATSIHEEFATVISTRDLTDE